MRTKIYAMMPESVVEWERRRLEAMTRIPRAELTDDAREEIKDFMDHNREFIRQYMSMFYNQRQPMKTEAGVATIHVNDYLGSDLTFMDRCIGASDYADIEAEVRAAMADPTVKAVRLLMASGGGQAWGCVELGRIVALLNKTKLVYAVVPNICGSAAYAIACGSQAIFSLPSSLVGCVGSILSFVTYEGMLAEAGITPHIFANNGADLKATMTGARPPTEAETRHLQEQSDEYGSMFGEWVMERRPQIPPDGYRGQALSGRKSLDMGFIDGIATADEVLTTLQEIAAVS